MLFYSKSSLACFGSLRFLPAASPPSSAERCVFFLRKNRRPNPRIKNSIPIILLLLRLLRKKVKKNLPVIEKKSEKSWLRFSKSIFTRNLRAVFFLSILRLVFDAECFGKKMTKCCRKKYKTYRPKTATGKTMRIGILVPAGKFGAFCKIGISARQRRV